LGYADNFLKAASLCQGDLIAFCDQDDIWMEQKLSVCSEFFADDNVFLAIHSAQKIGKKGHYPHFTTTNVLNCDALDPFANHPGFAMVFRQNLLQIAQSKQRPSRLHSHDHWLWFLAASTGKIATIDKSLTKYRQHGNNVFGAPPTRSVTSRAKRIIGTFEYDTFADFELECARFLLTASEQNTDLAGQFTMSARRLEFRSRLHRLRTRIYSRESSLLRRAITFGRIFFLRGYWPDRSGTRLGIRAAAKDLLFGVPGAYRLIASEADAPQ
jgi:hypothetical protein